MIYDALKNIRDLEGRVSRVEAITSHVFKDKSLALQAITHPSAVEGDSHLSYERLEFLGDSIVGFAVGLEGYRRFPDIDEGILTKMRIAVVNGNFLSEAAVEKGLQDCVIFGTSELSAGSRGMHSALEDVFEAITAALFLDGGMDVATAWVLGCLGDCINPEIAADKSNPKSLLQEKVQADGGTVSYDIVSVQGPSHSPSFVAEVSINDVVVAQGMGASKKTAEKAAAQAALDEVIRGE